MIYHTTGSRKGAARVIRHAAMMAAALILSTTAACSSPEEKVEKYTQSGLEYLEEGDLGRANIQFKNALKIDESHVPALIGLSQIMEQRQDFRAMFGLMQKIVRLDPDNVDALVKLGKLYLISSDEAQALEYADKALALAPEDPAGLALKAAVKLRIGDEAGAVDLARRALDLDPGNAEAVAVIVAERAKADDNEGALASVEKALETNREAAVLHLLRLQLLSNLGREDELQAGYLRLIGLYPDTVSYRQMYVNMLLKRGDYAEAREQLEALVELQPGDVDSVLDVVRIEYQMNGVEAATDVFKKYVDEQPDNTELRFMFGHFLRQEGDLAGAEAIYAALAKNDADKGVKLRAWNEIAGIRLLQKNKDEARRIIDEILDEDDGNPAALVKRAGLKIDDEDYDDAIADLRTAIANDPALISAKLLMASAFERKGDVAYATSQLAQAVQESGNDPNTARIFVRFLMRHGDNERAEQVLLDSLAAHPRDLENLKLLAALRLSRQDWRGAEEAARLIEEVNANEPSANRILGAALTGLGDYSGAIDALSAANEEAPLAARPLATLVSAYLREGRSDEAKKVLDQIIESNDEDYAARLLLAQVLRSENKIPEMEEVLRAAVAAAPDRSEAVEALYRVFIAAQRFDEAEEMLNASIEAAPDNDAFKVLRADLLITTGRPGEALDVYSDILSRRPEDLLVSNNYASLLLELRDDRESLKKALEIARVFENSDNPYFLDTLGWALYRNGAFDEAVSTLETVVESAEEFAEAQYHLGAAYLAAGRTQEGRARLEKAISLAPEAQFANEARALLEQD